MSVHFGRFEVVSRVQRTWHATGQSSFVAMVFTKPFVVHTSLRAVTELTVTPNHAFLPRCGVGLYFHPACCVCWHCGGRGGGGGGGGSVVKHDNSHLKQFCAYGICF
jgi:hypothetical protein